MWSSPASAEGVFGSVAVSIDKSDCSSLHFNGTLSPRRLCVYVYVCI